MFRNSRGGRSTDSLLPTSGNGRGGGGGMYGGARSTRQSLSKSFIATIAWAVVSFVLMFAHLVRVCVSPPPTVMLFEMCLVLCCN